VWVKVQAQAQVLARVQARVWALQLWLA